MTKQKQDDKQPEPQKICFVIAPIGEANSVERLRSDQVFRHMISPVVKEFDYKPERADLLSSPGMITNQIMDYLFKSELVVADLTDHNPNVFYELALRHAFAKPVIPILKEGQKIPFDNNQVRTLFYDHNDLDSVEACKQGLRDHIKVIEGGDTKFSNPVTNTVELEKLKESADPEARQTGEILSVLSRLQDDVKLIRGSREGKTSPRVFGALDFISGRLIIITSIITQVQALLKSESVNEAVQSGEISNHVKEIDRSVRVVSSAFGDVLEGLGDFDSEEQHMALRRFRTMRQSPFLSKD